LLRRIGSSLCFACVNVWELEKLYVLGVLGYRLEQSLDNGVGGIHLPESGFPGIAFLLRGVDTPDYDETSQQNMTRIFSDGCNNIERQNYNCGHVRPFGLLTFTNRSTLART